MVHRPLARAWTSFSKEIAHSLGEPKLDLRFEYSLLPFLVCLILVPLICLLNLFLDLLVEVLDLFYLLLASTFIFSK